MAERARFAGAGHVLGAISLLALLVSACSSDVGTVVDGWPIGAPADCAQNADSRCPALLPFARQAFDDRDPGHAAIVSVQLHVEGSFGSFSPVIRSSLMYVAVFHLADGSTRAIGVIYPGVSNTPMAMDYRP